MYDPLDPTGPRPVDNDLSEEALDNAQVPTLEADGPFPWDEPSPDASSAEVLAEEEPRRRHDGFTEARKSEYLKALVKTGCIAEACRRTGIARRTVYRHQQDSPGFFDNCCTALRMSATPVELTAWRRAVEGVEEVVVGGGKVQVRRRYSEGLLRLLLQGSNPGKYGPRPGFKRKRLLKAERKQMEREIRAEIKAKEKQWSFDDAIEALEPKLKALGGRIEQEKLAAGWTKIELEGEANGYLIPPGYARVGLPEGPCSSDDDGTPLDSM